MSKRLERVKRAFSSLRMRFVAVFTCAITVGALLYLTANVVGNGLISSEYLSPENKAKREFEYHENLQEYIDEEGITFETIDRVSEWARKNQYVYLLIYKEQTDDEAYYVPDDQVQSPPTEQPPDDDIPDAGDGSGEAPDTSGPEGGDNDSPIGGGITVTLPTKSELLERAKEKDMLFIELPENQYVYAKFAEFTEYLYYDISNLASLALAVLAGLVILLLYITRLTRRISRLGNAVTQVAAGNTDNKIALAGEDELAELATNVETMRSSIVENYKRQKEALDANTELITSMSHDIRTPLTVLLGYIDVMRQRAGNDEQMQEYLRSSEKTALRLKELSDDMFGSFLVFGRDERTLELCDYDADTLIEQLISEHVLLLRESGYAVEADINSPSISGALVCVDIGSLVRMVDNVFSNLHKYAEPTAVIRIRAFGDGGGVHLILENRKRSNTKAVESNGIGLKTCKKLGERMNVDFETRETENDYFVNITLRIK